MASVLSSSHVTLAAALAVSLTACQRSPPSDAEIDEEIARIRAANRASLTMAPFAAFDFSDGAWAAYVFNDVHAHRVLEGTLPGTCLVLRDAQKLAAGLRNMRFSIPSGGDLGTPTSMLVLVHEGRRVYETFIALDVVRPGLQSPGFGWIEAAQEGALLGFVKQFEAVREPEIRPTFPLASLHEPCLVGQEQPARP